MELPDQFTKSSPWPGVLDERADIAATPAVYALLHERSFGRLRGESTILYIGCTGEFGGTSDRCRLRIYRYPNGAHAHEIRNRTRLLEDDGVSVSLAWTHLPSREDALALEANLLRKYQAEHGELPPLNART
jgi:hypothetical protein